MKMLKFTMLAVLQKENKLAGFAENAKAKRALRNIMERTTAPGVDLKWIWSDHMKKIENLKKTEDDVFGISYPPSMTETFNKINEIIDVINELSAEYAIVRRGHWDWNGKHFECSVCKGERLHDLVLGLDAAFCPRCGANME